MQGLFDEVLDGARPRAFSHNVSLESRVEREAMSLEADPRLLGQVLTVLVDNAVEACLEDGSREHHEVILSASREGDMVRIDIRDDGAGMDDEVKQHIFEDFYSTKGSMGTGLGLVVVSKIVKEHGGTIDFESAPGEGTTFTVKLPARERQDER
jgi:signal transduction histidine kinase